MVTRITILCENISIHALREEGDRRCYIRRHSGQYFYPRPPRGGRRWRLCLSRRRWYFYPRPPRGGRRSKVHQSLCHLHFYPRPPRGGRRDKLVVMIPDGVISIHALREEGDDLGCLPSSALRDFYPRPPRGGRRGVCSFCRYTSGNFYPRPPRGGRQLSTTLPSYQNLISIHALREEGDYQRNAQPGAY